MALTLLQLRTQLISRLTTEYASTSDAYSSALLALWLSEGYREIQRRERVWIKSATQNVTADTTLYTPPADILDRMIERMTLKNTDNSFSFPEERTLDFMRTRYGDFSNPEAAYGPVDWCWENAQIRLMFPPLTTVTNGMTLDYVPNPPDLSGDSDVSGVETARPGLCGYAPVEYALMKAREMETGVENAAPHYQLWEMELSRIRKIAHNRPGLVLGKPDAWKKYPGLRRS